MTRTAIHIELVEWTQAQPAIRLIRETVFVREQGVPLELEWDGLDPTSWHVLAWDEQGEPTGTGRLYQDGKQARFGRMAVLKEHRGRGVGRALLLALLDLAQTRGMTKVYLAAQVPVVGFYEKQGFQAMGAIFDDAGIPHRAMTLVLPPAPSECR
ncbi:MAG: GNAT family N-acetyltransferase [Nitrospirae bacterium]|nr:MAG: GNAT family N-acetyltransferase [Nitrospirota bacterium]